MGIFNREERFNVQGMVLNTSFETILTENPNKKLYSNEQSKSILQLKEVIETKLNMCSSMFVDCLTKSKIIQVFKGPDT